MRMRVIDSGMSCIDESMAISLAACADTFGRIEGAVGDESGAAVGYTVGRLLGATTKRLKSFTASRTPQLAVWGRTSKRRKINFHGSARPRRGTPHSHLSTSRQ